MYLQVYRKTNTITFNPTFYNKYPFFLKTKYQNRKRIITLGANNQI